MTACTELDNLRRLVRDNTDLILDAGYTKDLRNITIVDKEHIIRALFLHSTIYRSMAELDQLKTGLNVLGVCNEMKRNPDHFTEYFNDMYKVYLLHNYVKSTLLYYVLLHTCI